MKPYSITLDAICKTISYKINSYHIANRAFLVSVEGRMKSKGGDKGDYKGQDAILTKSLDLKLIKLLNYIDYVILFRYSC